MANMGPPVIVSLGSSGAYLLYSYLPFKDSSGYINMFAEKYGVPAASIKKIFTTYGMGTLADMSAESRCLQHRSLHEYYGDMYDVAPSLSLSIEWMESKGRPQTLRQEPKLNDYSAGLMQTLTKTASSLLGKNVTFRDLYDPATSIQAGIMYLAQQQTKYGDQGIEAVVSSFNGGRPLVSNFISYTLPCLKKIGDFQQAGVA